MNKERIIAGLIAKIRKLRAENKTLQQDIQNLNEQLYYAEETESRLTRKNKELKAQRDEADRQREDTEREYQQKEWNREDALNEYNNAKRWNDSWGMDRAMRKLKDL